MVPKAGLRTRLRYWFDNTMSRGTPALIGWLAIVSAGLIVVVSIALAIATANESVLNVFDLLWQTFVSAFSVDIPDNGGVAVHAIWFLLALGGIFVVSALVGLLTSGLNQKLEELRKGRSAVVERDHTVILGWSDQVFTIVAELVEANRSRRRAAVVILAEEDKLTMEDLLRHRLGSTRNTRVVCRTGNPLDVADLELVNLNAARSIIVLAPETDAPEDADAAVLKTLLAINRGPAFRNTKHHVVAAVRDSSVRAVTQLANRDAVVIDADDISARLVVQAARQSGLSAVYHDLLDFGGDELYVVSEQALVGQTFGASLLAFRQGCPIGLVRADGSTALNPPMDTVIAATDKLVILAGDDSAIRLSDQSFPVDEASIMNSARGPAAPEHTLVLGWNGRAARIIDQLDQYVTDGSGVVIVTERDDADGAIGKLTYGLRNLAATVKHGDIRERALLESLDVATYDNVIVLCDDHMDPLAADARVLVTLLHLRDILAKRGEVGAIVSEMRDDRDRALAQLTRDDDFVISEQLVSLLMAQISENKHLDSVFADLFDPDGSEIYIRQASYYVRPEPTLTFATLAAAARRRGEVAIGYRIADSGEGHGMVLNPDKAEPMPSIDRVIVLARG